MPDPGAEAIPLDAATVQTVLSGNPQAYAELVRRYQSRLRSVLSFYCRSADEVEEFLQEAFVQAYTHLRRFDPASPFYPWLKTIALNALRMEVRRQEARRARPDEYLRRLQMARVETDPDAGEAEARGAALRRCLEKLPKPQSDLLVAKYREGKPLDALARGLGTTIGALKVRLLRLREALRDCVNRSFAVEKP
jgi:RNA polymerase sigma-70 factor (ECF subfamily)